MTEALRLQPDLSEAWATSGFIAALSNSLDDAESKFQRAIEINPNNATARHWYSNLLRLTDRREESLEQIGRAITLDPMSSVIRLVLGDVLQEQGRFLDAEQAYRKALTIDPLPPGSHEALAALTAYALGRPADVVLLARKAVALDPGSPSCVFTLALLLDDLGESREAMQLAMIPSGAGPIPAWSSGGPRVARPARATGERPVSPLARCWPTIRVMGLLRKSRHG